MGCTYISANDPCLLGNFNFVMNSKYLALEPYFARVIIYGLSVVSFLTYIVVVFPAPLWPKKDRTCPSYKINERSFTASFPLG